MPRSSLSFKSLNYISCFFLKNRVSLLFLFVSQLQVSGMEAQTTARFYTTKGDFDVVLREDLVPITAGNFIDLVDTLFCDGVRGLVGT